MKEGIESLSELRTELAEFFCEDAKSFRIEDCFMSLGSFCSKFKQAVGDNAKRREQEQRRAQREAEDIKRRRAPSLVVYRPKTTAAVIVVIIQSVGRSI